MRGVGEAFDGLYYVKSVKSKIKRGEFKQDFTLSRNGLISTLPQSRYERQRDIATARNYFGKYRGTVINNLDPMQMGRLHGRRCRTSLAICPINLGDAVLPVAGKQMGCLLVPLIGSGVWIEFEQGDPDYPIWVGCFSG